MDKTEINILEVLSDDSNMSQRQIAKKTNMSLGMVNKLIKKCAKKGLVKIEGLNSRSVKYILTPKGIEEKARKTLEYVSKSYRAIQLINNHVYDITQEQIRKEKKIVLFGDKDEMYRLIVQVLKDMKVEFAVANKFDEILKKKNIVVYLWTIEFEKEVSKKYIPFVNLLK